MARKTPPAILYNSALKKQVLKIKIDKVTVILDLNSPFLAGLPCTYCQGKKEPPKGGYVCARNSAHVWIKAFLRNFISLIKPLFFLKKDSSFAMNGFIRNPEIITARADFLLWWFVWGNTYPYEI